jgi:hypothetical protein
MSVALHSYKVDDDGRITVRHTFYAATEEEAEELLEEHADGCKAFGPAVDEDETIEILEENVAPPDAEALAAVAEGQEEEQEDDDDEEEEDAVGGEAR